MNFKQLIKKFDRKTSLEASSETFIRHNVFSDEGQKAAELYEKAVGLMKARSAANEADPFGWLYQAGIHGTFWTNLDDLTSKAVSRGYGTRQSIKNGKSLLNNCTHFSGLWNNVARQGEDSANLAIANDITINFLAWHRLYLQSFESVVRHVLEEAEITGADHWALPYWNYTAEGEDKLPDQFLASNSPLYEKSRSLRMNRGEALSDLLQPSATIALGADLVGTEPESIFDFQKLGHEKASAQTSFAAFSTYLEQNPHNNMHDAVGGISDYNWQRDKLWNRTTKDAEKDGILLWGRDPDAPDHGLEAARHDSANASVFGNNPTTGPGLMGFVPAAARDPVFWIHHANIDKIWSDWNASNNAAYLHANELDKSPWNYEFFVPKKNGSPKIKTYSSWGDNSAEVIAEVYNPNYAYDHVSPADDGSPNPVLALLDQPSLRPVLSATEINQSIQELAYKTIALNPSDPLKARDILDLRENGITLTMELQYSVPMSASQNIAVLVGDDQFLTSNSQQIQQLWKSWIPGTSDGEGARFNDPAWGSVYDSRGGAFAPNNLSNFAVGTINLLPMAGSPKMEMDQASATSHAMVGTITVDLTDSIYRQSEFNLIKRRSDVAMMLAASEPNSQDNQQTFLEASTISIHYPLNQDNITGSSFDAAAYFSQNPELLHDREALADPQRYYRSTGKSMNHERPTFKHRAIRLGESYLATNPELIDELGHSPYQAIDHYLNQGLQQGLRLSPNSTDLSESLMVESSLA